MYIEMLKYINIFKYHKFIYYDIYLFWLSVVYWGKYTISVGILFLVLCDLIIDIF